MDKGTMYFGGIMIGVIMIISLVNNWLATFLDPRLVNQIGGGLMLLLMVASIIGLEAWYILRTSAYPHFLMLIRPSNEVVEIFFDMKQLRDQFSRVGANLFSTPITFVYPRKIKAYGNTKVNQIRLLHEYEPGQRFIFQPGRASLDEYTFNHPQTEFIEVTQILHKSTSIDRAEVIPEYKVLAARNDYRRSFNVAPRFGGTALATGPVKAMSQTGGDAGELVTLQSQLAQEKSEKEYWHQQAISTEQWVVQQRTETRALLGGMNSITAYAIELMLQLIKAFGSIDKAMEHLRGTSWDRWGKWVVIGLIAGGVIVYLQLNPQVFNGIYTYFSNSTNQIVIIALLAALVGLAWILMRRNKQQ